MADGTSRDGVRSGGIVRCGEYTSDDDTYLDFAGRVISDAGLRLRITQALSHYDISKSSIDDLGYKTGPFVIATELIKSLELEALSDEDQLAAADALLGASIEVRDMLNMFLNRNSMQSEFTHPDSYMAKLPYEVQVVVLAKAFAGSGGSPLRPNELEASSEGRQKVSEYLQTQLMYSKDKAYTTLDMVAIIHGAAILADHLQCGLRSQERHILSGYPDVILGQPAPRVGYCLPYNVEEALRTMYFYPSLYHIEYVGKTSRDQADIEEDEEFVNGLLWLGNEVAGLSGTPPDKLPVWRAYAIATIYANEAFKGSRVQGFSSSIDRLCSWDEPKPDATYWGDYTRLCEKLAKCREIFNEFAEEGVLLALKGFAMRIAHTVEQEVIYGQNTARTERMKVVADIYKLIAAYNPQQANELLATTPLLGSHIKELADPSGYRFSQEVTLL